MNRLGFIFLSILREKEATSRLSSMTVRELSLAEDFGVKENTLFKKAREFERRGYVGRGLKEGRAEQPKRCRQYQKLGEKIRDPQRGGASACVPASVCY